ncbi:MAG: ATP-dependent RNA helicase, partial [Phycisphaerae bacterium]|nr:ATP-dependent RNA helicase [Phycisphaerae bacterium]
METIRPRSPIARRGSSSTSGRRKSNRWPRRSSRVRSCTSCSRCASDFRSERPRRRKRPASSRMTNSATLPVRAVGDSIVAALRRANRLVLSADTGSGKSTQVPRILLESGLVPTRERVLVLEPRRLAARLLARRVAEELGGAPGDVVGWQTRFERVWSERTRVGFVTEGVFLRKWMDDPALGGVGAVVLDEFHERSVLADLALGLVRRTQREARPDLKLIVMSATLDAEALAPALGAERIHAEGRRFPVETRHHPPIAGEAPWSTASAALEELIHEGAAPGDVLVFMPGAFEIDRTVETMSAALARRGERAFVAGLHGSMSPERQDEALQSRRERRVIVATNVAQTSITIDGVATVIDSGTARVFRHDPRRALDSLVLEPISRAAADQRAGRAGRTRPGNCVRLWSERDHASRPEFDEPEIRRVDLCEALLTVAAALPDGWADIERFEWVDAPPREHAAQARRVLEQIGCLDAGGAVTEIGRRTARLPLHPRLGRALVEAERGGAIERTAAWCAIAASRDFVEERDAS